MSNLPDETQRIAVIGMSGRFPGARDLSAFWDNLIKASESVSFFSDEELLREGVAPVLLTDPQYVKAGAVLDDPTAFDASFFGVTPREAELMDPQHRLLLECAYEALESCGTVPGTYPGRIGVFVGVGGPSYLINNLIRNPGLIAAVGEDALEMGNRPEFAASRISYRLNLRGPAVFVNSACSTSLVAVHQACQSLLAFESDLAIAGGATVKVPHRVGYFYRGGDIGSPDGHCRAFDVDAAGCVPGNGVGLVVLKRLADALEEGDPIRAVILGSAINNDGSGKVGFTAPGLQGQAEVIADTLAMADIHPDTLGYVEAHGTGTALGDPVEVAALTQVFREATERRGFCALGSLKTNMGHLDVAAGVAGLIKTVLALENRVLPPTLHFKKPNPHLNLEASPFFVNTQSLAWKRSSNPRRAGVSSFGIGGTNAHVVLEEAPERPSPPPVRTHHLLVLSAKTQTALDTAGRNMAAFLERCPDLNPEDLSWTLQTGRDHFEYRQALVFESPRKAGQLLTESNGFTGNPLAKPRVAFLFPGQGSQRIRMMSEIYQKEPVFRERLARCFALLKGKLDRDLESVIFAGDADAEILDLTTYAQPALFCVSYALAGLWASWGIRPEAMLGHSIGEYVAACLAGVFSLEDALSAVVERARLMGSLPEGGMVAAVTSPERARTFLDESLSLAAFNGEEHCVFSGPLTSVTPLAERLTESGIPNRRLRVSHAFHSPAMDPILDRYRAHLQKLRLTRPTIPFVSNLTGSFIQPEAATDPDYWVRHLREPVRFHQGLTTLLAEPDRIFLEVGPGAALTGLARKHRDASGRVLLTSTGHGGRENQGFRPLLEALGRLWVAGVTVDWAGFHEERQGRKLSLPTYPFERKSYWIEPDIEDERSVPKKSSSVTGKRDPADRFYSQSWSRADLLQPLPADFFGERQTRWLIFEDSKGIGALMRERLSQLGQSTLTVTEGCEFSQVDEERFILDPDEEKDYSRLFDILQETARLPDRIVFLWPVTQSRDESLPDSSARAAGNLARALFAAKSLVTRPVPIGISFSAITVHTQSVLGSESLLPELSPVHALVRALAQEHPHIRCTAIDLERECTPYTPDALVRDIDVQTSEPLIAYRGSYRWIRQFQSVRLEAKSSPLLREEGVYLITGGLGHIGLILAEFLGRAYRAKLILITRSPFPEPEDWEPWQESHGRNDPVSRKTGRLRLMGEDGAEIQVFTANVADPDTVRSAVDRAESRFGPINGIFHLAGITGGESLRSLVDTDPDLIEAQFEAKAKGLMVLDRIFKDRDLDFRLAFSSLATVLGGLGQFAYAAANIFMDTIAGDIRTGRGWRSLNWDAWQHPDRPRGFGPGTDIAKLALSPAEGQDAVARLLSRDASAHAQILVSAGPLQPRFDRWVRSIGAEPETAETDASSGGRHPRPALSTAYLAPRDELEAKLTKIWRELFGIESVGVRDNFFELGGDSLLATQMASRLRMDLEVELPVEAFFESPTIEKIAENCETLDWMRESVALAEPQGGNREGGYL